MFGRASSSSSSISSCAVTWVSPQYPPWPSSVSVIVAASRNCCRRVRPTSSHSAVAASLSDSVIIARASPFSRADSGVPACWCQRSSAARMIVLTMLAESMCRVASVAQEIPVTASYTVTPW